MDDRILPSRGAAWARLRAGLESPSPVLLTGEAGSGKTWLARRIVRDAGPRESWAWVDVGPGMTPAELLGAILDALGDSGDLDHSAGAQRRRLAQRLGEASADGRCWGLVVDELQLAGPRLLEELRLLANTLGTAAGLGRLLLLGQTPVLRTLATSAVGTLGTKIDVHVHLAPLDFDDARAWLDRAAPGAELSTRDLETLHRDSGGNAVVLGRLIRGLATPRTTRIRKDPGHVAAVPGTESSVAAAHAASTAPAPRPAPLLPTRPPLVEDEGLIEVGWPADATETPSDPTPVPMPSPDDPALASEVVEDAYTALQAWQEWAASTARAAEAATSPRLAGEPVIPEPEEPNVWLDPAEPFAPYGDLFARNRPATPRDG